MTLMHGAKLKKERPLKLKVAFKLVLILSFMLGTTLLFFIYFLFIVGVKHETVSFTLLPAKAPSRPSVEVAPYSVSLEKVHVSSHAQPGDRHAKVRQQRRRRRRGRRRGNMKYI